MYNNQRERIHQVLSRLEVTRPHKTLLHFSSVCFEMEKSVASHECLSDIPLQYHYQGQNHTPE